VEGGRVSEREIRNPAAPSPEIPNSNIQTPEKLQTPKLQE
jgi:hypothetical protein